MPKLKLFIAIDPMGKPRMTQRDKWKKRPRVLRYQEFADRLRDEIGPDVLEEIRGSEIVSLSWEAMIPMPKSWSKKKRAAMYGLFHRSKPDRDNIDKAILDALFKDDSGVPSGCISKRWGKTGSLFITVQYEPKSERERNG